MSIEHLDLSPGCWTSADLSQVYSNSGKLALGRIALQQFKAACLPTAGLTALEF